MPNFQIGQRGVGAIIGNPAMRARFGISDGGGSGRAAHWSGDGRAGSLAFHSQQGHSSIRISGTTKDSTGAALGNCIVQLFRTVDDAIHCETTSDANGNYVIYPFVSGPFYIVAYKAGSPDVTGATRNNLEGA